MKRLLPLLFLLCFLGISSWAQTVQWASEIIAFSSELTPLQYSAKQVLGKPNVLPAGGQNPSAWAPDKPGRKEFLKVGFANPISIRQIAIAESYNPGSITKVYAYDPSGKEYEIFSLAPRAIPSRSRMFNLLIDQTPYKVVSIKIEFDGSVLPGYFGIDAVAISDVNYPVIADIPKPLLLASGIIVEPLDKNVNSAYPEINPLLSPDGKTLYFSRRNHPDNVGGVNDQEDIWYSELDANGRWQIARNMTQLNNEGPNFISTISSVTPDGKSAIMVLGNKYLEKGKMQAGVSISSNVDGKWTQPVALNIIDDYNFNEKANYFLANNRKMLLMSVEREDTYGDRDLYVSFMNADSSWTAPLNLGDIINTASEESAPFLASDEKTMYFSSKGFSGYGGSDVYVSRRLDDTWQNWSDPENLGPQINSPLEDIFFNIPALSEFAYYSRGVNETNTDIYRVKLPILREPEAWVTIKGKVIDATTGKPLGAKIIYERLPEGKEAGLALSSPTTGEYEIQVPAESLYGVRAEAPNMMSENQNIDLRNVARDAVLDHKDFVLSALKVSPIKEASTLVLNNIFFDFDKAILRPESFPELDRLAKMLGDKTDMEIEVSGHADHTGPTSYNQDLSQKRAEAVAKYLTGKGIAKQRIAVTAYGESKPVETNETLEGRRKNRRVEFKILKL